MAFAFCSTTSIVLPLRAQGDYGREDVADHQRREAHRRLVEHDELWPRHEGAADREHLLLAAGEGAGELAPPLLEPREELEDGLEVGLRLAPAPSAAMASPDRVAAELEVLEDGEGSEELAPFGHERAAAAEDGLGPRPGDFLAFEGDAAGLGAQEAGEAVEESRLSRAVCPDYRDDLAGEDVE